MVNTKTKVGIIILISLIVDRTMAQESEQHENKITSQTTTARWTYQDKPFVDGFSSPFGRIDTQTLPKIMLEMGFSPPEGFKALVILINLENETPSCKAFDWYGSSNHREGWWPASTIKIFAAVAALEKVKKIGFTPKARIMFWYENETYTEILERLVWKALVDSDNHAFDHLVEIVGFDEINGVFFPSKNFERTVFLRAYGGRFRDKETGVGSNRYSPKITLEEGGRLRTIPERKGKGTYPCPNQGNCTTLLELADALFRVMLHEHIPASKRFRLGKVELDLLRSALGSPKKRGFEVVDGMRKGFQGLDIHVYHKPGFAYDWFSDCVFVELPDSDRSFIVAMAGYPGRNSLNDASFLIGRILASKMLEKEH